MAPVEPVAPVPAESEAASIEAISQQEIPSVSAEEENLNKGDADAEEQEAETEAFEEDVPIEPPSAESLDCHPGRFPPVVSLDGAALPRCRWSFEEYTVQCNITGPHEAHIVGPEGRTLDSLQYLLRKMVARHLPDRIMLALNAGDFRERRAEELKVRAVELAESGQGGRQDPGHCCAQPFRTEGGAHGAAGRQGGAQPFGWRRIVQEGVDL